MPSNIRPRAASICVAEVVLQRIGQFGAVQAMAPALGVELRPIDVRNAGDGRRSRQP